MSSITYQADIEAIKETLYNWIISNAPAKGKEWLDQKLGLISAENAERQFYLAFGTAPRFVGKEKLQLTAGDIQKAGALRKGWNPAHWTTDQATRILLVLSLPHQDPQKFVHVLNQLFSTGDVGEQTALYLSLPLLPHPELHRHRTTEGIRTNMTDVFNAIALDNPYPSEYLDEPAWNQLVLKTIFVGSPLHRIHGLDQRANANLARMLSDFAHERWAAGRPVPAELWRPVGPFLNEQIFPDMEKLFNSGDTLQQSTAALACQASSLPQAKKLLNQHPQLADKIALGQISWDNIQEQ
ncbi:EboA domain-containing protein [Rhodocytophaga rosea]|uniref:EboA domain-containing protein n=1 Tax=Rhodocytophaga rosea TaxID=2704465 RepID=UPI0018D80F3A|nr:EboA domain-containing protein [Rhodocytophaga rosea]